MRIRCFLILLLLLLSACSTKESAKAYTPKALPSWYVHPPQNDSRWLYATGEGVDRQSAVTDALNMMAAGLSVTIDSHYRSDATQTRTGAHEQSRFHSNTTIHADVEKIRISHFDVLQGKEQSFRNYIVLLRAERARIAEGIRNELKTVYAQLHNREAALQKSNTLSRYLFYRNTQKTRPGREQSQRILTLLEPEKETSLFLDEEQALERRFIALSRQLCFRIRTDTPLGHQLHPVLREGLNTAKLHTDEESKKHNCLTLRVDTHENRATSMGLYLARADIVIQTLDATASIVASRTLHLVGQSSQEYAIAQTNVAVKLKKTIQHEGIFAVMGWEDEKR